MLDSGLGDWTNRIASRNLGVADTNPVAIDAAFQRGGKLLALAQDIYPRDENSQVVEEYLSKEALLIQHELDDAHDVQLQLRARERVASQQYQRLIEAVEKTAAGDRQAVAQSAAEFHFIFVLSDLLSSLSKS